MREVCPFLLACLTVSDLYVAYVSSAGYIDVKAVPNSYGILKSSNGNQN